MLWVTHPDGNKQEASISLLPDQPTFTFTPKPSWTDHST